jgi:hypothetical protein
VDQLYGRKHFWAAALGVRMSAGAPMHRMGRYGAAEEEGGTMEHGDVMHRGDSAE